MAKSESLSELEQQARSLPPDDRARLAEVLLESLQGPPLSEIEERIAAYDRGDQLLRHSREGGNPASFARRHWVPAFAGTTPD